MQVVVLILSIIFLLAVSGICSGLNIAVMAIDISEINRKARLGQRNAKQILPLKNNIHLPLVSILIANIASVSGLSLLLNTRINGFLSVLVATFLTVLFGEIFPQAIFNRNPMKYLIIFMPLLKIFMIITYPISKPLQILLDKMFPKINSKPKSRRELGLLISDQLKSKDNEINEDEIAIMTGALELSTKKVLDIMTPIKKTYYLHLDTALNDLELDKLKERNYSRIPILDKDLKMSYGYLILKDLIDINFDDNNYKVKDMVLHKTKSVGPKMALDTLFREFIRYHSHLLIVKSDNLIIGIVTIEDLFEEIIGHEIEDEADILNRSKY